jgi:hypothetical protein
VTTIWGGWAGEADVTPESSEAGATLCAFEAAGADRLVDGGETCPTTGAEEHSATARARRGKASRRDIKCRIQRREAGLRNQRQLLNAESKQGVDLHRCFEPELFALACYLHAGR